MSGYIGNIPVPQATQSFETFTATGGQTSFGTAGYTPGYLQVYLNGVLLDNGTDYTASNGSDVVLAVGAISGDILTVISFSTFEVSNQAFTGDFSVDSPTFVVDSTNNRVGIGTASPSYPLTVEDLSSGGTVHVRGLDASLFLDITSGNNAKIFYDSGNLEFNSGSPGSSTERMRITNGGNVGIGTSLPDGPLHVAYNSSTTYSTAVIDGGIQIENTNNTTNTFTQLHFRSGNSDSYLRNIRDGDNLASLVFLTDNGGASGDVGEVMRLDNSGNVLVGKTAAGVNSDPGFYVAQAGNFGSTVDGGTSLYINRQTSDGDLIEFRKDATTIGTIGVGAVPSTDRCITIGKSDVGMLFDNVSNRITPWDMNNNNVEDAAIDLGYDSGRFKDLYLSGGVYIGGTGAANKLEDYEEGTFTLTLGGTGGDPTVSSYTYNTGYYRKIGDVVCINCFFEIPSGNATGGSGDALLKGLPFSLFTGQLHLSYVEYTGSYSSGRNALTIRCVSGENRIRVRQMNYTDMGLNINTALGLSQFISGLIKIEVSGFFIV